MKARLVNLAWWGLLFGNALVGVLNLLLGNDLLAIVGMGSAWLMHLHLRRRKIISQNP